MRITRVVHERRDLEHSDVHPRHLVQHFELFEELDAEVIYVLRVRDVDVVVFHLRVQGVTEHVREGTLADAGHRIAEHRALAQSAPADGDLREIEAESTALMTASELGKMSALPLESPFIFMVESRVELLDGGVGGLSNSFIGISYPVGHVEGIFLTMRLILPRFLNAPPTPTKAVSGSMLSSQPTLR